MVWKLKNDAILQFSILWGCYRFVNWTSLVELSDKAENFRLISNSIVSL